jgi:hypothetical protein
MFDYIKTGRKPTTFLWLMRFTQESFRSRIRIRFGHYAVFERIFYPEAGMLLLKIPFKMHDKNLGGKSICIQSEYAESVYSRFY